MINSRVYAKAYDFAIRIVNAYKHLTEEKREFVLSKQLLKSGTSIGTNIAEANGRATPRRRKAQGNARGAISTAEFRAKMSIAYKECLETIGYADSTLLCNGGTLQRLLAITTKRH